MSPDELRQHLFDSECVYSQLLVVEGIRGIASGTDPGTGSLTDDAKDLWTGLETHET